MLAHHGKDVPFNLFTMIDLHYRWGGKLDMNYKGLLASREDQTVAYAKPAYFAAQYVFTVFDDSLIRIADFPFTVNEANKVTLSAYQQKATGKQVVAIWFSGAMPNDSNMTTTLDITLARGEFTEPVYADLRTGEVYAIPKANWSRDGDGVVFRQIPVYDSPILIAERSGLELEKTTAEHVQPAASARGTLLQFDFNDAKPWQPPITAAAEATVEAKNIGTIDVADGKNASGGLLLVVDRAVAKGEWVAALNIL
jgi:hypothetical protein